MTNPDEQLQELIDTLTEDHKIGVLLAVQMGNTPQEVQLVMQTADYDEESMTVTTGDTFIIRCIGVQEHRISVGMFNRLVHSDDHPLLWKHNYLFQQIYFNGTTDDVDGLMLDLNQLYGQNFGSIRSLADDINRMAPLGTILGRGHGLLGEMPAPLAEKVKALLEHYGMDVKLIDADQDAPPMQFQLLVLDDSYFIAQMYSADPMAAK